MNPARTLPRRMRLDRLRCTLPPIGVPQTASGCCLNNGADANSVDREGISVLQAAVIGGSIETVKLLLDAGADPDHEDVDGDTPRSCANDDGSEEIKQLFSL